MSVPATARCLALDMDGTVCTSSNTISPATVEALTAFSAGGGTVLVATGRSVSAATEVVDKFLSGVVEYCVCMDGAVIVQAPDWRVVHRDGSSGEQMALLLAEIGEAISDDRCRAA